jgi:2-keto-4-pentenoate hydratase
MPEPATNDQIIKRGGFMNEASVQAFVQARGKRPDWPDIDARLRPVTIADGYRLQDAVHRRLAIAGDARVGWKVGSTSASGQRGFGLHEPVYAGLFAGDRSTSLAEALSRPLTRPSLECEIAVVLRRDIDGADPALSIATITDAIGACHIACEIIDNRYGAPMSLGVPSLIADDFFQVGFVVGAENTGWRTQDLAAAEGFIEIDGQRRTGSVRDVLAAFDSLRWLAVALVCNGLPLRAGELVLTGTLVTPTPVALPARAVSIGITGFETLGI